jgi:hypothetical protein
MSELTPMPYHVRRRYVTPTWVVWINGQRGGTAVKSYRTGKWHWRRTGAEKGVQTPARNVDDLRLCVARQVRTHPSKVWLSRSWA